CQQFNSAPPTC
nr:immunoglobulin light chain junction region [Macaca mulatta]